MSPGVVATANSTADAISLSAPNARAVIAVSVSQTTTSSTPIFDARTGQTTSTVTTTEPIQQYSLHSGSTADGAFALDLTATAPPTGRTDELGAISIRRGLLTAFDRNQRPIPGAQVGLHAALGTSDVDPLSVMGGLVADQLPNVGDQANRGTAQGSVTSVTVSGAVTTVTMSTTDSAPGALPTTQRRVYVHRNGKHVLQEMQTEVTEAEAGVQMQRQVRMQFTNVAWSRGMIAEAASAAATTATSPWGPEANIDPAPCVPTPENQCDEPPPGPGTGTPSGCSLMPNGANIVYVHGINADGNAWGSPTANNAVRGTNRCDLVIAQDIAPSLTAGGVRGLGRHADQAAQLRTIVGQEDVSNPIFVGHSQGGLVSRRVAQVFQPTGGTPLRAVRGVVTTGTPHRGANIANNASLLGLPGRVIRTFTGGLACRLTTQCAAVVQAMDALQAQYPTAVLSSDAMRNLRPSSNAITAVNAPVESFPRFGIQNALTSHGFLFYQVAGDAASGNRGRTVREIATAVAAVAFGASVVATIVSIFVPWAAIAAAAAAVVFSAIVGADLAWSTLTYGNQPSDGVVERPSQVYPGTGTPQFPLVNRLSDNPSSHTAQIDSERSAEDLQVTLREGLGVVER